MGVLWLPFKVKGTLKRHKCGDCPGGDLRDWLGSEARVVFMVLGKSSVTRELSVRSGLGVGGWGSGRMQNN